MQATNRPSDVSLETADSCSSVGFRRIRRLVSRLLSPLRRHRTARRTALLAALVLTVAIGTGAVDRHTTPDQLKLWRVRPTLFRETVETTGSVEPLHTQRVVSQCRWSVPILSVVPEGTWVQKGDVICVLDGSEIEEYLRSRELRLIRARAGLESAVQDELLEDTRSERRLAQAEFDLQDAELALQEYLEGEWPEQLGGLDRDLLMAEERLASLQNDYDFTERLWIRGQVGQRTLEEASLQLHQQESRVNNLSGQRHILTDFTNPRTERQLSWQRDDARRDLVRTRIATSLSETKARLQRLSDERRVSIYERYVQFAKDSLDACTLRAPRDGQLVHSNSWYWKSRGRTSIEPGRDVRFQQAVFEIPDSDRFKVSVPLNESLIKSIRHGMPATVRLAGFDQQPIAGEICHISRYPRQRRYQKGIQDYWLDIELFPTEEQRAVIRSKMDATATLTLREIPDALMIPRKAVVGSAGEYFVWRMESSQLVVQPVRLGGIRGDQVVVTEGLQTGDQVATELSEQHREALEQYLNADVSQL